MTSEIVLRPKAIPQRIAELIQESWKYFLVSVVALAVDYGLLLALTEISHMHYLVASAISYTTGGVIHYLLSVSLVFRSRRVEDRWVEFAAFFGLGLLGLAATQAILKVSIDVMGLSIALAKVGAVGTSFALNFIARKALLFSKTPSGS